MKHQIILKKENKITAYQTVVKIKNKQLITPLGKGYGFKNMQTVTNSQQYNSHPFIAVSEHQGNVIIDDKQIQSQYASIKEVSPLDVIIPLDNTISNILVVLFLLSISFAFSEGLNIVITNFGVSASSLSSIVLSLFLFTILIFSFHKFYYRPSSQCKKLVYSKIYQSPEIKNFARKYNITYCKNTAEVRKYCNKNRI